MSDQTPKQQIVDTLKDVDNILVTVNANPTVDELSAVLGFTLLLNKLDKHATAVFSGDIPPAITFLDPEKTFENTVDSLRDFIIALDKEKADHLRYKVDGDMVKIFITPFRTTISEDDLDFSQGDYNVEAVVAIGVQNEADLDKALADHGRIMHDATVTSLSIGNLDSNLGTINWHEQNASSYSEMLVSLSEALRNDKNLIDEQIATAFLTGIVAATDRFSNEKTSSTAMTMAAQLMAAGANQQLIAARLEEAEEISDASSDENSTETTDPNQMTKLDEGASTKVNRSRRSKAKDAKRQDKKVVDRQAADGTMQISHEKKGDLEQVADQVEDDRQAAAAREAEAELDKLRELTAVDSAEKKKAEDTLATELKSVQTPVSVAPSLAEDLKAEAADNLAPPSFGGVLNATTEQAAEDTKAAELQDKNKTILSHGGSKYVGNVPDTLPPVNSFSATSHDDEPAGVDLFGGDAATARGTTVPMLTPAPVTLSPASVAEPVLPQVTPQPAIIGGSEPGADTLADIDSKNRMPHDEARAAIDAALQDGPSQSVPPFDQIATASSTPASAPQPIFTPSAEPAAPAAPTLPPLPPMPDFSTLPPLPTQSPASVTGIMTTPSPASEPVQSPVAEPTLESILPPLPEQPAPVASEKVPPVVGDPAQFQIPGQN